MQDQGTVLKSLRDEWGPPHMMVGYPVDNLEAEARLAAQAARLSLDDLDAYRNKLHDELCGITTYHIGNSHGQ